MVRRRLGSIVGGGWGVVGGRRGVVGGRWGVVGRSGGVIAGGRVGSFVDFLADLKCMYVKVCFTPKFLS